MKNAMGFQFSNWQVTVAAAVQRGTAGRRRQWGLKLTSHSNIGDNGDALHVAHCLLSWVAGCGLLISI